MCKNTIIPMNNVIRSYRIVQYVLLLHMHFLALSKLKV